MNTLDKCSLLLGILCSAGPLELEWPELDFARRLILLAEERKMVAFLTTPCDLDFANGFVTGYTIKSQTENTWYMECFPFPQVIYNRVGMLIEDEAQAKYSYLFSEFVPAQDKIHVFNCGWLNKWDVYKMLIKASDLKVNIPATGQLTLEELGELLNKFRRVYVKPQAKSLGEGIIRVTKWPQAYFCEFHNDLGKRQTKVCNYSDEITDLLLPNESYLVQQDVRLASIDGQIVDFRVHIVKNGHGEWEAVATVGRRAPRQGIMTHSSCGGTCESAEALMTQLFTDQAGVYLDALIGAALAVARCLDKQLPGALVELGLDLGLDQDGRPWLLEVNERPNHVLLRLVDKQAEQRLASLLLDYIGYLANAVPGPVATP